MAFELALQRRLCHLHSPTGGGTQCTQDRITQSLPLVWAHSSWPQQLSPPHHSQESLLERTGLLQEQSQPYRDLQVPQCFPRPS